MSVQPSRRGRWFLMLILLLCGRAALAAPPAAEPPERCEHIAACRSLLTQGRQSLVEGRYEEAQSALERAHSLSKDPRVLMDLGRTLQLMGKADKAADAYQSFLATAPHDRAERDQVVSWLREALLAAGATEQPEPEREDASSASAGSGAALGAGGPLPLLAVSAADPAAALPACGPERLALRKRLRYAGAVVTGAGALGLIASSVLAGLYGQPAPGGCGSSGEPSACGWDTSPAYIGGFAASGLTIAAGATLLVLSERHPSARVGATCRVP